MTVWTDLYVIYAYFVCACRCVSMHVRVCVCLRCVHVCPCMCVSMQVCVCVCVCWQVGDILPNYNKQYRPTQHCTYKIQATIIIIQLTTHCMYAAKVSVTMLVNLTLVNSVSIRMVLQNNQNWTSVNSMIATAFLTQSFIMMHGDTHNINKWYSGLTLFSCCHIHLADSMYTGVGRVGFHGNMFTQCSRLFWTNSLIGGFTTGDRSIIIRKANVHFTRKWIGSYLTATFISHIIV